MATEGLSLYDAAQNFGNTIVDILQGIGERLVGGGKALLGAAAPGLFAESPVNPGRSVDPDYTAGNTPDSHGSKQVSNGEARAQAIEVIASLPDNVKSMVNNMQINFSALSGASAALDGVVARNTIADSMQHVGDTDLNYLQPAATPNMGTIRSQGASLSA